MSGSGNITVWINSPGGDCVAAAQIYNMLMDYKGDVTVKIDGIAASAASVIAMAGTKVLVSPVSMLMIHNPMTAAFGNSEEMQRATESEAAPAPTVSMLYSKANVVNSLMEKIAAKCAIGPKPAVQERTGRSVDELRAKLNTIKNYI